MAERFAFARTTALGVLAALLSILAVRSFGPKPAVLLGRTTRDGIGLELRWMPLDRSLSVPNADKRCYGNRQLQLDMADMVARQGLGSATLAGVEDLYQDRAGLLSVEGWSGSSTPDGHVVAVTTLMHVQRVVTLIRATYPGGGTDEVAPVGGWAAIAVRVPRLVGTQLMGTIEAFDASGSLLAKVDASSARSSGCLGAN